MMAGIKILLDSCQWNIRKSTWPARQHIGPRVPIRLLPVFPNARVTQVGNAAGSGAKMALLSTGAVREAVRIARRIRYIELAKVPTFQAEFLKGMGFPQ
jgi:uncharacterized 2Fe-2S/4Fe-4S cluster protein (DUF4445 family)